MMTQEEKRAAYYKTPQRLHVYESTDKAKEIVQQSMAIDTLFSGVVPLQWSTPQAPEFHDEMDKIKAAGVKVNEADKNAFIAASKAVYEEFGKEVPGGADLVNKAVALGAAF